MDSDQSNLHEILQKCEASEKNETLEKLKSFRYASDIRQNTF